MEKQVYNSNPSHRKLAAAALSGSLLIGNALLGGAAFADAPPPVAQPFAHNLSVETGQTLTHHQLTAVKKAGNLLVSAALLPGKPQQSGPQLESSHPKVVRHAGPSETLYVAWSKVATCEEGGWSGSSGSAFPDSLGITSANWYDNGGGSDVTPAAQIAVGQRIIHRYGISIPDQNGCDPGGW